MILFLIAQLITVASALNLPSQLNGAEQSQVLESIGLGTSTKFLSQAYPFGGYQGLEVSIGVESVSTELLAQLGTGAQNQSDLLYPNLSVGKGLFNNSEIIFNLTPQTPAAGLSRFGLSFRWSFYQTQFIPLNFSFVAHGSSANFQDRLTTRNVGGDLLIGLTLKQLSIFTGAGWISSAGLFTGGVNGLTLSQSQEGAKVDSAHFLLGLTYNFDPFFLGVSVDHYQESTYNLKIGLFL